MKSVITQRNKLIKITRSRQSDVGKFCAIVDLFAEMHEQLPHMNPDEEKAIMILIGRTLEIL